MADQERVHIKLGLSGTYWEKKPQYRVSVNDQVYADATISDASDLVEYVEFDVDYATDSVVLKIELLNKENSDTIENSDKTAIIKDMLLNIVSIEIDDIDVEQLIYGASKYIPDDPKWPPITECINLGWTGDYIFTFECPVYLWLLENM